MIDGAGSPAARLLEELSRAAPLRSVWLPEGTRRAEPGLEADLQRLGLQTTLNPVGDEDAALLMIDPALGRVPDVVAASLRNFASLPFLVLLGDGAAALSAAGDALLASGDEWFAGPPGEDAMLVAPRERLFAAEELPGAWRAAPMLDAHLDADGDTVAELWDAAEADRRHLRAVVEGVASDAARLERAHEERDRIAAQLVRVREADRRELDRMRVELLEQRAWVASQAARIAASRSWRIGHRLVRIGRALTLRHDRGTNLPEMIAARMDGGDSRH